MKRLVLIFGILAVALLGDGLYMELSHYQPGDQNTLFGNPRLVITDGTTVLVAGGCLLLVTVLMWFLAVQKGRNDQHDS
jgi:hypothetical protein